MISKYSVADPPPYPTSALGSYVRTSEFAYRHFSGSICKFHTPVLGWSLETFENLRQVDVSMTKSSRTGTSAREAPSICRDA